MPRRASDIVSPARQAELRAGLLSGERSLVDFARQFPPEGAAQVFLPTGRGGGRYIDHMFVDGSTVVLRGSKNVRMFRLTEGYRTQIDKDVELLTEFVDARVDWRITGALDDAARAELDLLVTELGGRFRYVTGAL
ncbi:hypothetical protein [Micromonospora chersina]|uniref:hypothetical protein n=1 Tax=Micromonospora chersina TaxID=47854 RepID=UPI0036B6ACA8